MKTTKRILLSIAVIILFSCGNVKTEPDIAKSSADQQIEFYQLKTYLFDNEEQMQVVDLYLEHAFLPGLEKLGIKNVGIFKPIPYPTDSIKKTLVLIPFTSFLQLTDLDEQLESDEAYRTAGSEYLTALHDQAPYQRVQSVLLKAFDNWPVMKTPKLDGPRSERVYELRSYESATEAIAANKRHMFNAGGEITIFDELGCNPVFFGEVISGAHMPNLMYMTTYSNQASRDEHWKKFGQSPAWEKLKTDANYQNNVSHIDIDFLYPTEYSAY